MRAALLCLVLLARVASADAVPVKLRFGTVAIDGTKYMEDITAFSADVAKRTKGTVELAWYPSGQLGDEQQMLALIREGKLDGAGFSENGLVAAVPEMAAWRYPGLFASYAEVDRATAALDGDVRALFAKQDLVFAMWADLGFANVFTADAAPATLRDLLVRAAPWLTQPLEPALFAAVVAGKARAWAMPPLYMFAIGQVQPRALSRVPYRYVIGGLVIAQRAWARLSPEQQAGLTAACAVWEPKLRARWRRETDAAIATLAKAGARVTTPAAAELAAFFAAAAAGRGAQPPPLLAHIVTAIAR